MMHIGLLGFGVVGGGVWALCAPRDDLNVKRVLLRSPKEGLPEEVVTFNADDILNDPEIDTVVEVMGGLHPAYEYVSAALARGKNVVTANKALIAAYYTASAASCASPPTSPSTRRWRRQPSPPLVSGQ